MPRSRDSQAAWSHVSPVLADVSGCAPLPQEVGLCMRVHTHVCVHVSGWEGGDTAGCFLCFHLMPLRMQSSSLFHHFLLISFSWN